jgi:hypothetical protein
MNGNTLAKMDQKFDYNWAEFGFWTEWIPSHSSILLCITDRQSQATWCRSMEEALRQSEPILRLDEPFDWHAFVLPHITAAFDRSVWSCRDLVRFSEQNRPNADAAQPQHSDMHELARHAIHITETISMALNVLDAMKQEIETSTDIGDTKVLATSKQGQVETIRELKCQQTLLQCAHERSRALRDRLQNEISLVHTRESKVVLAYVANHTKGIPH